MGSSQKPAYFCTFTQQSICMKVEDLRPEMKGIIVAVIQESGPEDKGDWNVYLVNHNNEKLEGVMVTSRGYGMLNDEQRQTSTIRWFFEEIPAHSFVMIEPIVEEVFGLSNEYWVSFYMQGKMYDKKYIFLPETIDEKNLSEVPVINGKGVMIR